MRSGGKTMKRQEMIELRGRITHLLDELENIRRHIDENLNSPAPVGYETLEDDLINAADRALNDR